MTLTAQEVWRDFDTDGVPGSGAHQPAKSDVRTWGASLEAFLAGTQAGGGVVFATLAAASASLAYSANQLAWVTSDSTPANNGIYQKQGASGAGSWLRLADLPYSFYRAINTGAGTANAIKATNADPLASGQAVITFNIVETNTSGTVTISFNGGSALNIKTAAGNNPVVGGLASGMLLTGLIQGENFRLLSDQASAAVQAAAEAAAATAEAARDIATGAMSVFLATVFSTKALAEAYAPAAGPDYIRLEGYTTAGDGGGALYKKITPEPTHDGKFSITLSDATTVVWYELTGDRISDRSFGVKADGVTDDTAALTSMAAYVKARGGGHIVLDGGVRKVWPSDPSASSILMDLSDCEGVVIEYLNGASINVASLDNPALSSELTAWIWWLTDTKNVEIINPKLTHTSYTGPVTGTSRGAVHFGVDVSVTDRGNIRLINVEQSGGLGGLICYATTGVSDSTRVVTRGITLTGKFSNVFYPSNFQGNGDDVDIRIMTRGCGRSYFPYNVSHHRVFVDSDCNGSHDDVLIKNYTDPTLRNTTSDIDVTYRLRASSSNQGNAVQIAFQQADATSRGGSIRDIHVRLDVDASFTNSLFNISKTTSAGAADNTGRTYEVSNITLSGRAAIGTATQNPISVFGENWTGDTIISVAFEKLVVTGGGSVVVALDGRGIAADVPGIRIADVFSAYVWSFNNTSGKAVISRSNLGGSFTST